MALCSVLSAERRAGSHRGIGVAPRAKRKAQKGLRLMNGKGLPLAAPRFAPPAFDPWVQQSPQPLRASKGPNGFNFNLMDACPNTLIVFSGTSRVVLIATNDDVAASTLTCPGQCVLQPRTRPWMTAALMVRPAILHSACRGTFRQSLLSS